MAGEQRDQAVIRVLRLRQVTDRLGLSRSTIYDRMNPRSPRYDSSFPTPISLGCSAVGWLESDICHWIDLRVAIASEGRGGSYSLNLGREDSDAERSRTK